MPQRNHIRHGQSSCVLDYPVSYLLILGPGHHVDSEPFVMVGVWNVPGGSETADVRDTECLRYFFRSGTNMRFDSGIIPDSHHSPLYGRTNTSPGKIHQPLDPLGPFAEDFPCRRAVSSITPTLAL